ncbi:hypothetical protein E4U15_006705 [Claviceps sp. LM218 group G6]|nr:hypothetical protein E4U15_006705 [Claviceps sp. LM218 group G6]
MMSHKNWNDRADKDLFFTILSLKDVGLISGEEWCRIGNHMRCLGYRFTNEGCRQHFQGLRRAQNKAAAVGTAVVANPYHADPTLNPVTRRPGPGRGRPKKHSLASAPEVGQPVLKHTYPTLLPRPECVHLPAPAPEQHIRQAGEAVVDHGAPSQPHGAPMHVGAFPSAYTADARHVSLRAEGGCSGDGVGVRTGNDGGNRDEGEGAVGRFEEERAVKRRRFEEPPDLGHSVPPSAPPLASASAPFSMPPLAPPEEEAVLALAAHTGASGPNLQGNTIGGIGQFGPAEGDPAFLHDPVMCFYLAGTEAHVMPSEVRKDIEARMRTLDHQVTRQGVLLLLPTGRHSTYPKTRRGQASTHEEQGAAVSDGISESATPRKRIIPVKKAALAKLAKSANRDGQS